VSNDIEYIAVASLDQLPAKKTLCVQAGGKDILLCNTPEGIFAVDNLCTHAAEKLEAGRLKGCKILCPLHGAAFDVRSGEALSRPAVKALATYPVLVDGDSILVAAS
jgi:3-phenylpropionate/trans-cinnamate dioxygenase ferredoxin subunit